MSAEAMNWAKFQTVGGPGPKAVLMALADYADENCSCHPGQALLAQITEQSERTVREQLAKLEAAGFFRREPRYRPDGRGRTSDRYVLSIPADFAGRTGAYRQQDVRLTGKSGRTNRQTVAALRTESIDPRENHGRASAKLSDGLARLLPSGVQWAEDDSGRVYRVQ